MIGSHTLEPGCKIQVHRNGDGTRSDRKGDMYVSVQWISQQGAALTEMIERARQRKWALDRDDAGPSCSNREGMVEMMSGEFLLV